MFRQKENYHQENKSSSPSRASRRDKSSRRRRFEDEEARSRIQYNQNNDYEDNDNVDEELQWRETAQMLSDDDEIFLTKRKSPNLKSNQNRREEEGQQQQQQQNRITNSARTTPDFSGNANPSSADGNQRLSLLLSDDGQDYLNQDDGDDNSSISFAQSGCHSILSAWRIKAANKQAAKQKLLSQQQQQQQQQRPNSVLSNASSSAKKSIASTAFTLRSSGRAPASQSRIPLGPRNQLTGQPYFVTNSRRRRRANELILTTLEARRRALALNRQNASLFGSGSLYFGDNLSEVNPSALGADGNGDYNLLYGQQQQQQQQHQRQLSLSPSSPQPQFTIHKNNLTPTNRSALSDLGGSNRNNKVLQQQFSSRIQSTKLTPPPMAKPDQNSSDLYTSNSSSSEASSSESSESSQFTQLVTSELAPDCVLLDEQALRPRIAQTIATRKQLFESSRKQQQQQQRDLKSPPKLQQAQQQQQQVPIAQRRKQLKENLEPEKRTKTSKSYGAKNDKNKISDNNNESNSSNKLRRGALRRDSIRRLRLDRQQQEIVRKRSDSSSSSSSSSSDIHPSNSSDSPIIKNYVDNNGQQLFAKALPKSRRLDIENNPFLNRGHFRSTSVRSQSSRSDGTERLAISPDNIKQSHRDEAFDQQHRRNSWLFGSNRNTGTQQRQQNSGSNSKIAPSKGGDAIKSRSLSEVRRSNSTEAIQRSSGNSNSNKINNNNAFNERNKLNKQCDYEQEVHYGNSNNNAANVEVESVQNVEQMLRQMKPNQVFTSYNNNKEISKQELKQQNVIRNFQKEKPSTATTSKSSENYIDKNSKMFSTIINPTNNNNNNSQKQQNNKNSSNLLFSNENKNRNQISNNNDKPDFVRQGLKSHSDLKFDLNGNKTQIETEKRWRYEINNSSINNDLFNRRNNNNNNNKQEDNTNRINDYLFKRESDLHQKEERLIRERMEIVRSTSISPPAGFSEKTKHNSALINKQQQPPPTPIKPRTRLVVEHKREPIQQQQRYDANLSRSSPSVVVPFATSNNKQNNDNNVLDSRKLRSTSVDRPIPTIRTTSKNNNYHLAENLRIKQTENESQLPTFERTADDEFKKRVDYLRRLAKANLTVNSTSGKESNNNKRSTSLSSDKKELSKTKPMTTNWKQQQIDRNDNKLEELKIRKSDNIEPLFSNLNTTKSTTLLNNKKIITSSNNSLFDERADWKLGPLADRQKQSSYLNERKSPATTNLDLILGDRYQSREELLNKSGLSSPYNKWHRSNSSLASLYTTRQINSPSIGVNDDSNDAKNNEIKPKQKLRPLSPLLLSTTANNRHEDEQQLQQRKQKPLLMSGNSKFESGFSFDYSGKPEEKNNNNNNNNNSLIATAPESTASEGVVKLLVKEKTAPRLNYAFVEQQPNLQHVVRKQLVVAQPPTNTINASPTNNNNNNSFRLQSSYSAVNNSTTNNNNNNAFKQPSQLANNRVKSPPLRVASPRSPEFGGMATSSNDDSAIASSVSSPSLSFMQNNNNHNNNNSNYNNLETIKTTVRSSSPLQLAAKKQETSQISQRPQLLLGLRPQSLAKSTNDGGTLQSILRRAHHNLNQQYQQNSGGESSDSSTQITANNNLNINRQKFVDDDKFENKNREQFRPLSPAIESQQQQQSSASNFDSASSPPKRVHFNDRTSIRSFESISSLASNSTAIPNEMAMLRQQIGSPDSMGSGSGQSRLSAESPDLRKNSNNNSGAAIYAIRGDPELDFNSDQSASLINAIGLHTTAQLTRHPYGSIQHQQQQLIQAQQTPPLRYPSSEQQHQMLATPAIMQRRLVQQQQQQFNPAVPYIRMTAPPAIKTSSSISPQQQQQQQGSLHHGYIVRPTSLNSTHIMPTMNTNLPSSSTTGDYLPTNIVKQTQLQALEDDEDPSYALRLRQAATSRVFQYGTPIQQQQQQQQISANVPQQQMIVNQRQQQTNIGITSRVPTNSQGLVKRSSTATTNVEDYLNFQTEV